MFFDEEMLLDLRLNIMNKYVDKFVITESTYMHSGSPKKLIFNINKFSKFKDKIVYIPVDKPPPDLIKINDQDNISTKQSKMIVNAKKREMYQINKTQDGIVDANPDDIIIVSDVDEIPNLAENNLNNSLLNSFSVQRYMSSDELVILTTLQKKIIVTSADDETRIDRWLKRRFSLLTQSFIENKLRRGLIRVNHKIVKSNYKVLIFDGQEELNCCMHRYKISQLYHHYLNSKNHQ